MSFQTICRICITHNSEMVSIFEPFNFSNDNCEIFKVIADCASVQIEQSDGFSEKICRGCLDDLSRAYRFKKLCEDSDYKFRNNLIMSNEIIIKNEIYEDDVISHSHTNKNIEGRNEITNFEFIDVKQEQPDDYTTTENKNEASIFSSECGPSSLKEEEKFFKTYKCDICKKEFSKKDYLQAHHRLHTKDKPYKCNFCEKTFADRHYLTKHIRIHNGEQRYKCEYCERKFTDQSNLNKHIKLHKGEKSFKSYKCGFCEKEFSKKCHLKTHNRLHTGERPHKCSVCEKTFADRSYLTKHIRIHKGEQPHKCQFCQKKFTDHSNLIRHVKLHKGEQWYECEFCKKKFSYSSNLKRHMRLHNAEQHHTSLEEKM